MDHTIEIPVNSYTALRLTYAKPKTLNKNGKVILLGKVPDIWYIEDDPGLIKRVVNTATKKLRDSSVVGMNVANKVKSTLFEEDAFKPVKPYGKDVSLLEAVNKYMASEAGDSESSEEPSGASEVASGASVDEGMEGHDDVSGTEDNVNVYNGDTTVGNSQPELTPDNYNELLRQYIDTINEKIMKRSKIEVPTKLPDLFKDEASAASGASDAVENDINATMKSDSTINTFQASLDGEVATIKTPATNLDGDIPVSNDALPAKQTDESERSNSTSTPPTNLGGDRSNSASSSPANTEVRSVSTIVDSKSDANDKGDIGLGSETSLNDITVPNSVSSKEQDMNNNDTTIPNALISKDIPQDVTHNDQPRVNSVVFHEPVVNNTDDHKLVHEDYSSASSVDVFYTAELEVFLLRSTDMDSTRVKDQIEPVVFSGEKPSTNSDAVQHTLPSNADSQIYRENHGSLMVPSAVTNSTDSSQTDPENSGSLTIPSANNSNSNDFAVPPQLHQSNQDNEISPIISPIISITSDQSSTPELLTGDSQPHSEPRFLTSASNESQIPLSQQSSVVSAAVKWDSLVTKRNRKSITSVTPQPIHRIDDASPLQERDSRVVERLKRAAGKSKSKYINTRKTYRDKMFGLTMRNYHPGDIIRSCEMLVMIKSIKCSAMIHSFTENEYCDSRIVDRWKEYQVVTRMSDNTHNPIAIELHCTRSIFNNKKAEASYSFDINPEVHAQFYSDTDKTILIVVPSEEGHSTVFIFRTHNQVAAFSWLFVVKLAQRFNFGNVLTINVPKLSISLQVEIPLEVIYNLVHWRNNAKIHTLAIGYRVEYSPLLEYLREYIEKEMAARYNTVLSDFARYYDEPWFCYKRYDLLEWVKNDSECFYLQSLLLGDEYSLEIRDMGHYPGNVKIDDKIIEEPVPIEGFLSRLTNISGKEQSFLRSFYKMLYFFTSKNLLFYTAYYQAVPPSPNNNLITGTNSAQTINDLPQVFECSTFPISENDHIYWLHGDEFEHYDKIAQGEFTRKVDQIVKAKGFIDMARIKEIKVIPFKSITQPQKLLHCTYWYSNADLIDDETLVDSGFELTMQNGSRVKLLAPNRNIRDEWIQRLNEMRRYWKFRKQEDVNSRIKLKDYNQKALNISEFEDANVSHQVELNEIFKSEADISLDSIDSMALLTCILNHGYLFQKTKKHADFNLCYAILVPGYLVLYRTYKRSKVSGRRKKQAIFEHYITLPIANCYVYSGISTELDLLDRREDVDPTHPERHSLPRVYTDGWKSSEEEHMLCFTLWIGRKRNLRGKYKADSSRPETGKNPGISKMVANLGITGKSVVFMARSRQEQATWTQRILYEVDRHGGADEDD